MCGRAPATLPIVAQPCPLDLRIVARSSLPRTSATYSTISVHRHTTKSHRKSNTGSNSPSQNTSPRLAERVSPVAWGTRGSHSDISRFLKGFRDAPHRSGRVKSFVDELCLCVVRWFAVASAEDLWVRWHSGLVSERGGPGFVRAASFVGHLIECGLLGQNLVRRFIFKPLTAHFYNKDNFTKQSVRANAIYQLFTAAGETLLRGLLEPEVVQDCFEKLETRVSIGNVRGLDPLDADRLDVRCSSRVYSCTGT